LEYSPLTPLAPILIGDRKWCQWQSIGANDDASMIMAHSITNGAMVIVSSAILNGNRIRTVGITDESQWGPMAPLATMAIYW
jgi:hypothetical protein